jgi:carboxyl-terminal processing protease
LVLDLRGFTRANSVHPAVLLADCLLDCGPIGRIRTAQGETTYKAAPDALFPGWPIAVLVDQSTSGTAEWLAAALQDNHRAIIVGLPTAGAYFGREDVGVHSTIPVGDGAWWLTLTTGRFERGDGRPLSRPSGAPAERSLETVMLQGSGPVKSEFGVNPDHLAGQRILPLGGRFPLQRMPQNPEQTTTSGDSLVKARQLLRDALKKPDRSV